MVYFHAKRTLLNDLSRVGQEYHSEKMAHKWLEKLDAAV